MYMNIGMTQGNAILLIILLFWVLPWKGYALWVAAQNKNKFWFIAFLILNTLAILELIYLFFIIKKRWKDIKHDFKSFFGRSKNKNS